jgi:predicted nucleic-acid-binding Zn-ribbon protein
MCRTVWVCTECGSNELTDSVSESDLEYFSCTSCGCNEFTQIELTGEDNV